MRTADTARAIPMRRRKLRGFTMIEAAVVLVLVALLVGAVAVPLATKIESRRMEETTFLLDLAQEKLLSYALRMGYFPCPASATSNGQEAPGFDHTTGVCSVWHGFLPAAALGWAAVDDQGYAQDAWARSGNRIRYAVSNDPVGGVANAHTRVNGLANAGMGAASSALLFRVCGSGTGVNAGLDCGTAPTLAANAAVVVWSVGSNALTGGTSADEAQNPNPNGGTADRIFVSRPQSDGTGADYDDIVRWIPAPLVAARLQAAGMMTPNGSGTGGGGGGGGIYGTPDPADEN